MQVDAAHHLGLGSLGLPHARCLRPGPWLGTNSLDPFFRVFSYVHPISGWLLWPLLFHFTVVQQRSLRTVKEYIFLKILLGPCCSSYSSVDLNARTRTQTRTHIYGCLTPMLLNSAGNGPLHADRQPAVLRGSATLQSYADGPNSCRTLLVLRLRWGRGIALRLPVRPGDEGEVCRIKESLASLLRPSYDCVALYGCLCCDCLLVYLVLLNERAA